MLTRCGVGTGPGYRHYWYPHCPLGAVQPSSRFNENLQTSLAGVTCVFTCCAIDSILTTSVYVLCCGRYVLGDFANKYRAMSLMCISRVKYLLVSCCVRVNCIVRSLLLLDPGQHVCAMLCYLRMSAFQWQKATVWLPGSACISLGKPNAPWYVSLRYTEPTTSQPNLGLSLNCLHSRECCAMCWSCEEACSRVCWSVGMPS